jgi:hypothetical protein
MINMIKDFIAFISNMRSMWNSLKQWGMNSHAQSGRLPTGNDIANFIEQNSDPNMVRAAQQRPEWQAAKRSTVENQAELRQAAVQTAKEKIPIFQNKGDDEIMNYVSSMGQNLGFTDGGQQ